MSPPPETADVAFFEMGFELLTGLALFLMGMSRLSGGLKAAAGDRLRSVLERFTRNRYIAALTGAAVTALVQSSSITTVLVVGFVSAGVMTLTQSVGVILGANVGTTMTAQIVAFDIGTWASVLIGSGFILGAVARRQNTRHYGAIILGLGLVFFGMTLMSASMAPLRTYEPFIGLMHRFAEQPILALLAGAAFTALIQSSSATTGLVVVMASGGLISLGAGIALALGANVGTCVTAVLSALGKPVEARRAAAVHVSFNTAGALLWLPFIPVLAGWAVALSPDFSHLEGAARLAAETPRQIANANTLFNVINTLAVLPFAGFLAALAVRLVPDTPPEPAASLRYLNRNLVATPSLALHEARKEIARLGGIAGRMVEAMGSEPGALGELKAEADALHARIADFLSQLAREDLSKQEGAKLRSRAQSAGEFHTLCDLLAERIARFGGDESWTNPSQALFDLGQRVRKAIGDATLAIAEDDQSAVARVMAAKRPIEDDLAAIATTHGPEEMEIANEFRLAYFLARRVARAQRDDGVVTDAPEALTV